MIDITEKLEVEDLKDQADKTLLTLLVNIGDWFNNHPQLADECRKYISDNYNYETDLLDLIFGKDISKLPEYIILSSQDVDIKDKDDLAIEDALDDYLTQRYNVSPIEFDYELDTEDSGEVRKIIVKNIGWDIDENLNCVACDDTIEICEDVDLSRPRPIGNTGIEVVLGDSDSDYNKQLSRDEFKVSVQIYLPDEIEEELPEEYSNFKDGQLVLIFNGPTTDDISRQLSFEKGDSETQRGRYSWQVEEVSFDYKKADLGYHFTAGDGWDGSAIPNDIIMTTLKLNEADFNELINVSRDIAYAEFEEMAIEYAEEKEPDWDDYDLDD